MNWARSLALALLVAALQSPAATAADPLGSPRWDDVRKATLADAPLAFDARVRVVAPVNAENPLQVPVNIDASALADVREIVVFADFNPIAEALRFFPEDAAIAPVIGFRLKLQQSSPVRAAVRTGDGAWHVGGTWVNTVGGGCTAPATGRAAPDWAQHLMEVSGREWIGEDRRGRVRLRIVHPMDTGLSPGTPAFYIDTMTIAADGRQQARLQTFEPVSENPVFTFEFVRLAGAVEASGRDNNGNAFRARVEP